MFVDLVDCLEWEQSRCSVFIHERSSYDIRSSTNRATMTLGFRCFAQRQRRRQKRGEGERARARARNGMLLFSPLKSNSSAVLVLLSLCSRHSGNELLSLQARERRALFLICFISFHFISFCVCVKHRISKLERFWKRQCALHFCVLQPRLWPSRLVITQ